MAEIALVKSRGTRRAARAVLISLLVATPSVAAQPRRGRPAANAGGVANTAGPRLLVPTSGITAASRRPTFRWTTPRGTTSGPYTWQMCRDRGCTDVVASASAGGGSTWPASDLPPGMLFWRVVPATGAPSATWEVVIPRQGAGDGAGFHHTTDVNGDGFADVLRLAPPGGADTRRAFFHAGSLQGPSGARVAIGGAAASAVADAGDVNGDGYADLAVAPSGSALAVRTIALFLGGASGPGTTPSATLRMTLPRGGPILTVAGAGDCNGDGYGDVLVVQGTQASGGDDRVLMFYGGASALRATTLVTTSTNAAVPMPGESFAAALGDVNGDGFADVAVRTVVNDGRATGAVAVYFGAEDGIDGSRVVRLEPAGVDDAEAMSFGQGILGVGDANGDGFGEIAVGSAECVWAFAGGASGPNPAPLFTRCSQPSPTGDLSNPDLAGRRLAAGDFDGDGFADLLVGDAGAGPDANGYAYVFAGSAQNLGGQPIVRLEPGQPDVGDFGYGSGYSSPGDINCDGADDIVATSSGYSPVELFSGRTPTAVYLGGRFNGAMSPAAWLP